MVILFKIFHVILFPLVRDKKWLHERCSREYNQYEKMFKKFGIKLTREQFIEFRKPNYPEWVLMII